MGYRTIHTNHSIADVVNEIKRGSYLLWIWNKNKIRFKRPAVKSYDGTRVLKTKQYQHNCEIEAKQTKKNKLYTQKKCVHMNIDFNC